MGSGPICCAKASSRDGAGSVEQIKTGVSLCALRRLKASPDETVVLPTPPLPRVKVSSEAWCGQCTGTNSVFLIFALDGDAKSFAGLSFCRSKICRPKTFRDAAPRIGPPGSSPILTETLRKFLLRNCTATWVCFALNLQCGQFGARRTTRFRITSERLMLLSALS